MGVLATVEEAAGGVGGAAGMKREGMHATEATMEIMRTVVGREPISGFTRDATLMLLVMLLFLFAFFLRIKKSENLQLHRGDSPCLPTL